MQLFLLCMLLKFDIHCIQINMLCFAGKIINLRRLDEAISSINNWYMERGLFAMVNSP